MLAVDYRECNTVRMLTSQHTHGSEHMRYAVKIGEIHIRSTKPITDEQRAKAIERLLKDKTMLRVGGVEVVITAR
jgi:hypothetical protein